MKDIIISILNQCVFNKSISEFDAITKTIRLIQDKDTTIHTLKIIDYDINDSNINIQLWCKDTDSLKSLLSLSFHSDEYIGIILPCNCTHMIFNDSYNIQYNDIRSIIQAYEGESI